MDEYVIKQNLKISLVKESLGILCSSTTEAMLSSFTITSLAFTPYYVYVFAKCLDMFKQKRENLNSRKKLKKTLKVNKK